MRGRLLLQCLALALPLTLLAALSMADSPVVVRVVGVIDGDTVVVRSGTRSLRVRLLGADTPEFGYEGKPAEPLAREAQRFTQRALTRSETVELEVAGDRVDSYGRTLAFLWLRAETGKPPTNLSEELLREGLARAVRRFEYPGKARFLALEAEARRARRGLWGALGTSSATPPGRRPPRVD